MSERPQKRLKSTSYHVAWICPVSDIELLPAVLMLDEQHERPDIDENPDSIMYEYGSAAGHNIVLAPCRQGMTGNVNASSITGPLFKTFSNIRMTLLVGIGGGVPQPGSFADPLLDLRLGDVVVGWPPISSGMGAVIYYDSGRTRVDGFEITGTMDKPHKVILNGLTALRLRYDLDRSTFHEHMMKLQSHRRHGRQYRHPGLENDKLFKANYAHVGEYSSHCTDCDHHELVERELRNEEEKDVFVYHQGHIATGNSVVMDAQRRDSVSALCGGALCIEMEAAGVEVNGRCIVIRGISDYADSHKSDLWRSYAAGKAVAFARELLGIIPATEVKEKMASGQSTLYHLDPVVIEPEEMSQPNDRPRQALLEGSVNHELPWGQRDGNKHWLVDPPTNQQFTGRREVIDRIITRITSEDAADEQRRFVLTGMGGQGKSEICLHVANKVRDRFWGVFWVDVSNQATAEKDFSEVAEALGCEKTVDSVRKTLSSLPSTSQWLLILDNADNPDRDYKVYLPSGRRGAILITSRNFQCGGLALAGGHEELENLEEAECIQLLRKTAKLSGIAHDSEDDAAAVSLVRHLGHHTLAILHAGSYIATTRQLCQRSSIADYLEFLRTNRRRLLDRPRSQGKARYDTVYATFGASMEFLERTETGASEDTRNDSLELLKVLSTFHYISVPLDVLVDAWHGAKDARTTPKELETYSEELTAWHVAQVPEFIRNETDDVKFRIAEAVARLESLALVRTDRSAHAWKSVSMHPLVHGWAGDRRSQQEQKEALRMTECIVALSEFAFGTWREYYQQFTTHLKLLIESDKELVDGAAQSRCVLQVCVRIAWMYHRVGLDRDRYEFTSRVRRRLGLDDQEPTKELREVYRVVAGSIDWERSRPAEAVRAYEAIERLDEKTRDENDSGRLNNLRDLGNAYVKNGQTKRAVALLRKVVNAHQDLGEEGERLLIAQHSLAIALSEDGQNKEAIVFLEKVVRIRQRLLPADHPEQLASQQELAAAYLKDGQIAEATRRLEELARIYAQTLGEQHPRTANTRHWLADAYHRDGRLSEAIALYEWVINTQTLVLGEEHPDLLTSQHDLALAYLDVERVQEATGILERVVNIRNSTLDDTHPDKLRSQHELGRAYVNDGRVSEAIGILQKVVIIKKSLLKEEDHESLVSRHELARAYLNDGRVSEAIGILERVVNIQNSTLDDTNHQRLASQHVLSQAYLDSGRVSEAIVILEKVVEVERLQLLYGEGHSDTEASQELLEQAYAVRDRSSSSLTSLSASGETQPVPAPRTVETSNPVDVNDGPTCIFDAAGQQGQISRDSLQGMSIDNSLVLVERSGRAGSLRARLSRALLKAPTLRLRKGIGRRGSRSK